MCKDELVISYLADFIFLHKPIKGIQFPIVDC